MNNAVAYIKSNPRLVAFYAAGGAVALAAAIGVFLFIASQGGGQGEAPAPVAEATPEPPPLPTGVDAERVLFGQSAAFTGPAQRLGAQMRAGIEAAFAEVNRNGGVNGRMMELLSLDDSYEPETAVQNTARLIEVDGVFALIGAVGTPTSRAAVPISEAAGIPYIAPFTGAEFLRDFTELKSVINMRASYYQEVEEMVERLTTELGIQRIGVFYQDDSFGRAGYLGALIALEKRGMPLTTYGVYPRNTLAVKEALLDMRRNPPDAVIMVGAYSPIAEFVSWARHTDEEDDVVYIAISFSGGVALAQELGRFGEGVFVTQVVPLPTDESYPFVVSYLNALRTYDVDAIPDFVSLEGYLAGRLAIEGVRMCGANVDRECFLDGIKSSESIDIDGFNLSYGGDNQGSDAVYLTFIDEEGAYNAATSLKDAVK